ncbi:unnamed protein product [Paramecium octaurelia]|uniref:G domain-containing protein n=1 Tax=Paramecium octaurelia TaxID=43137 RepID=A0A8S1TIS2_PAROT|nr:unnamed protein product [Paramecium octaurelia]
MQNNQIQGSPSIDEKALLKMINMVLSYLYQFQKQKNNNMKVLILVGVTGSGKSTIFNLLGGAKFKLIQSEDGVEELELEEISTEFSIMKGGMQSVTKEPKYYFNEEFNHLLIDFPGFQDTNGEFDQIMIQMLFYKISTQSKVKILYVVRHPELEFQERGTNLQEFIKTTFKEQSIGIESLTLLLNAFNEENYSDELVKTSATEQIQELYHPKRGLNIIVLRKINSEIDIAKQFSDANRRKIWEDIIKSEEIKLQPIQILHIEKISAYLSEKSFKYIEKVWLSIQQKLTQNLQNSQFYNIPKLQNLCTMFKELPKITKTNYAQSYRQFVVASSVIAQQLGCSEEVKYKSEEFLKIYQFFQQFSDLINGYSECQKHSKFAQDLYNDMIRMIENKIGFLKENQKVQITIAEKNQEIKLKNNALAKAECQRLQKEQYQKQSRQLNLEIGQLQQKIILQRNAIKELENQTDQLRNKYFQLQRQSDETQRDLDEKIQNQIHINNQTEVSLKKKQKQLNDLEREQQQKLNAIKIEIEEQEIRRREILKQIEEVENLRDRQKAMLCLIRGSNNNLTTQVEQRQNEITSLKAEISRTQTYDNGCQLI